MKRILFTLLIALGLSGPAYAQQWDQVNGSMQVKSGPSAPLVIIDQTAAGQKIASFRNNGTEKCYIDVSGNLNCSGTFTLTGQFLAADGSASAPSYSFASAGNSDNGMYLIASDFPGIAAAGSGIIGVSSSASVGVQIASSIPITWSSGALNSASDVSLSREAAGHLFQRNSTNAQRASWANTYTSSTNYEAFSVDWQTTANTAIVGCRTAATGTGRPCRFASQANNAGTISYLEIAANGNTTLTGAFTSYNGVAVAGQGLEAIRAQATTGTVTNSGTASIATWTPGAADVEVEVSCRVNITVSTTHSFSCDVTYTDVANNARTRVLPMFPISGNQLTNSLMTNTVGTGDYSSTVMRIGVKASTAITVRTSAGGTFTTVTYTASGTIKQVG